MGYGEKGEWPLVTEIKEDMRGAVGEVEVGTGKRK